MKIYQNDKNGIAKLATLSDLVGGGINLLTGTNTGEGWNLSNGGFDDTANYANDKYSSLLKTKMLAHLWSPSPLDILGEIETLKSKLEGVRPSYRLYVTSLKEVA